MKQFAHMQLCGNISCHKFCYTVKQGLLPDITEQNVSY